ncbi:PREDICTED: uncharacterized protein LOC108361743 [Rhagoletis zephyria]|uniref:uncharacterized protein LOC108361743 n=1 Tax=Rhagoletis zephyria TaxID=28612 RepID=UPI0008116960|nr:PREDICTED: uncharacterized protein LOC108361743 [Rhagoletis zephyria]
MGVSTVREIVYDTCNALWTELHDVYVAQPHEHEWKQISDRFYFKTGMPNCYGAVDGKHIKIVCPARSGSLFYNYKNTYSIVLMAACDSNYTFTFVDVGAMGSESDGGIFSRSSFGKMILRGLLNIPPDNAIPGTETTFQYYFVGDNAFPLKHNLMRPYPGRNLSAIKDNFNKKLSPARVYIENSFGILASRWRILHTNIYASPNNVDKIVLATIVLHNYLMLDKKSGYFNEELVDHLENGVEVPGMKNSWTTSKMVLRCQGLGGNPKLGSLLAESPKRSGRVQMHLE